MPSSAILVLSADPSSAETITRTLTAVGYGVKSETDPAAALQAAADHSLIVLDVIEGERSAADLCREIRGTPSLAAIPVLCVAESDAVEERIAFLEAGADDVMARPFDERELEARVEALLVRFERSRGLGSGADGGAGLAARRRNHVVAVFSPKGGVGTTTLATNVATVEARHRPDKVLLIDLDVQFGQVATLLNLEVHQSLAELVRDHTGLTEPELLRTYTLRHDSGLHVLAAPPTPQLAELVEAKPIGELLETVGKAYESVVIDAGSQLNERTMAVLDQADGVVVPVHPEIAALKAVRLLLDYLNELGGIADKTTFVVNNMFAREILRVRDVESALGTKVGAELPYDPFLYLKAANEGVPLVIGAPRSSAADRLTKLTESLFGPQLAPALGVLRRPVEQRKARGLTSLLRRG